jgi:hypothetical protein
MSSSSRTVRHPDFTRLILAALIGGLFGTLVAMGFARSPGLYAADYSGAWKAAQLLLQRVNPYAVMNDLTPYPLGQFAYPLPAAIISLPVAGLSASAAAGVFVALGVGALAYSVLDGPPYRLLVMGSPCFIIALTLAQWSPLLTAAALIPPLGIFAVCKPNLGLALFARRPTIWMIAGGALLLATSFALVPSWFGDWTHGVTGMSYYKAPIAVKGGFILALAALRWRDPDARMLLVLSLVPSNLNLYDQLPLFLISRRKRDTVMLFAGSWLVPIVTKLTLPEWVDMEIVRQTFMRAPVVAFLFVPALYIVLSRPSPTGSPDLVDRVLNQPVLRRVRASRRADDALVAA